MLTCYAMHPCVIATGYLAGGRHSPVLKQFHSLGIFFAISIALHVLDYDASILCQSILLPLLIVAAVIMS